VGTGHSYARSTRHEQGIRAGYERFRVLDNFRRLSEFEELEAIFPEASKYRRSRDSDALFALGMLAVEAHADPQTVLFGLGLLFEALNDPTRARNLKELYDFDAFRYRELTLSREIFSDERLLEQPRRAGAMLEGLQRQLDEIETSAGWRLLQRLRHIRLWLAPPGTTREKIWSAVLSRARGRRKA
jgi:hypothetical protein